MGRGYLMNKRLEGLDLCCILSSGYRVCSFCEKRICNTCSDKYKTNDSRWYHHRECLTKCTICNVGHHHDLREGRVNRQEIAKQVGAATFRQAAKFCRETPGLVLNISNALMFEKWAREIEETPLETPTESEGCCGGRCHCQ